MNEFKLLFYMIYKISSSLTSSSFFQTPCARRPITTLKIHISLHINHMQRQYFLFSPRLVENAELLETPLSFLSGKAGNRCSLEIPAARLDLCRRSNVKAKKEVPQVAVGLIRKVQIFGEQLILNRVNP